MYTSLEQTHHHYHRKAPVLSKVTSSPEVRRQRTGPSGRHERAVRRRERPLRVRHRHERLTVPMELATALHHSAQRPRPVVEVPREEAGHVLNFAPRGPRTLPPGTPPGVLLDPEPQVRAVTVGYVVPRLVCRRWPRQWRPLRPKGSTPPRSASSLPLL